MSRELYTESMFSCYSVTVLRIIVLVVDLYSGRTGFRGRMDLEQGNKKEIGISYHHWILYAVAMSTFSH